MAIDLSTLTARQALTAIYIGYYDRAADPAGLAFWEDVVDADGFNLVSITTLFASASETQALFPFFADPSSTTPSAFITQLYQNLFNRDPDAAGLAFWTEQLQNAVDGVEGALTVGQIITSIIEGAQGDDATIIMNKITVALDWTDSGNAVGTVFDLDGVTGASARSIIDNVDETDASVVTAKAVTDAFFAPGGGGTPIVPGQTFILSTDAARDNLTGTEGNDTFEAYNTELKDGDTMDGGSGRDTLTFFNSDDNRTAISARTESVETVVVTNQSNDLNSSADNNVGGYSNGDETVEVDVELDAGQMSGVTRWEDFDSRADLVIEDARDQDDTDGTFTGDITVAMVSTDPGNVDYAVYFDEPVNVSQNFGTLELRVLDQEAADGLPAPSASSTGYLTESSLISFAFQFDGQPITVTLADELGVTYGPNVSFQDLLDQVENATQQALVDAGVTANLGFTAALGAPVSVGVGNQFTLPLVLTFDVPADTITASSNDIVVLGRDSGNNGTTPSTDTFGALSAARTTQEELIRLNVELDDVGKGSMGGDALFGAMSTGRQNGDDGTSDSIGIQQFDIEVDRSSQLQTINSTNNALEVVNITNGENDGPNNTTTATDEMIGDLVVRGAANPGTTLGELLTDAGDSITDEDVALAAAPFGGSVSPIFAADGTTVIGYNGVIANGPSGVATDSAMPGGVPQHNAYGFSDVRVINAAAMVGAVDITAELTDEIVEKYLDIQDTGSNGEADDVTFDYDLGTNNDEFLLNMSSSTLELAGTGSREDFNLDVDGNGGNDVITTNIGETLKVVDAQGADHYIMVTDNDQPSTGVSTALTYADGWYANSVSSNAASFDVNGGAGNDTIWTHGWGDATISDGAGADVVYTDNSGAAQLSELSELLDRNIAEHDQIDYVYGSVWAFNAEYLPGGNPTDISGVTNDSYAIATLTPAATALTTGTVDVTVDYLGAGGTAGTAYSVTVSIPVTEMTKNATTGVVSITEQSVNQAVKAAINNDAVLSNLLEAVDGPGHALVVYSKTDGEHVAADLTLSIGNVVLNGAAPVAAITDAAAFAANYNTVGTEGKLFDASVNNVDSTAESDNTIMVAGDGANDVYVLSTNDGNGGAQPALSGGSLDASDLNGASNEVLKFAANFGTDTVLNFDAGAGSAGVDAADDVLDFSMITGGTNTLRAFTATGDDVVIDTVANVDGVDLGTTIQAAEAVAYFLANGGTDDTTAANASEHILIVHDTTGDNGGQVWHITDGAGTGDVTAVNVGTINLIGTDWATGITADNIA
ncbi:DUF4214 domain-containing protein [Sulfitobacter sp. KE42]|uniref:DUF4214 domain-containing protein n=1 Tax=Sulfitobacter sp. KE42 TaxID=2731155 RepID=UPI0023E32C74|nr:DUF4214 domain-containing protein [Sulfitobacter sp. KE42]MDF3435196.1 DUF4214 domain-containing protein [Sulfitobacter sp. KE42]